MKQTIPVETLGPQGEAMVNAIAACVHCGFCLPVCPTYKILERENDSPRGRIFLMKEVLEGNLDPDDARPFIDRCLGCQACVPACPSGVAYGDLLISFRGHTETRRKLPSILALQTLPYPTRFRLAALLGRLAQPFKAILPGQLRAMLDLLPASLPDAPPLPEIHPARGPRRARVALLAGCAQQVLAPQINQATLRVLAENGVETIIPVDQGCCGALSMHSGAADQARSFARRNLKAFPDDVDAILTNAAGCGSGMKEYPLLFKSLPDEKAAQTFARRAQDVSVFLRDLGFRPPPPLPEPLTIAYHDACHLAHAQGIQSAPRELLRSIPNLTLLEIPEGETCCGSAGTYNLDQPTIARELGQRKARNIQTTGAEAVVAGNIGCMTQIQAHLERPLPVLHTMEVLARAYGDISHQGGARAARLDPIVSLREE
ncbi:MAG TPA: heterodisulfide reductase-related iron-sulfur binding cluster [Thermoanaerobaculia bacterium]|nr:heterodisulfide reductase-related iron-sulfur binding cluster [Thermoanaerobaculia bacterium]